MHGNRSSAEESVLKGLALFASVAMLLCSGYLNARFAISKAQSLDAAIVYGTIGVVAEVFCFVMPFFFIPALRRLHLFRAGAGLLVWVVCIAFSAQSAIGHVVGSRIEAYAGKTAAATAYQDTRAALKKAQERQAWLPRPTKSSGSLKADVEKHKAAAAWLQTNQCQHAYAPAHRTYCATFQTLLSDLANAEEFERLDKTIADLGAKTEASSHSGATMLEAADPQAATLGKWFGTDATTMQGFLSLGVAVLLLLSSLVPYAVLGPAPSPTAPVEPKEAPQLALGTQDGRLIDITPTPPQPPGKQLMLPGPAKDISPDARSLLHAMGIPRKPCDKREKDPREVLGLRFYAWMVLCGHTGEHPQDAIDDLYSAFTLADYRVGWDGMRIVKTELTNLGKRFVESAPRTMEDGKRPTVWTIKPASIARLTVMLDKAGVLTKEEPPPADATPPITEGQEPEPAAARNVLSFFRRGTEDEQKKASGG